MFISCLTAHQQIETVCQKGLKLSQITGSQTLHCENSAQYLEEEEEEKEEEEEEEEEKVQ